MKIKDKKSVSLLFLFLCLLFSREISPTFDLSFTEWRIVYDLLTDGLIIIFSLFCYTTSKRDPLWIRPTLAITSIIFLIIFIQNIVADLTANDTKAISIALLVGLILLLFYIARYAYKFKPNNIQIKKGRRYLLVYPPTDLTTLASAVITGVGGSFAETNGADIWQYSRKTKTMLKDRFTSARGAMILDFGEASDTRERFLESKVGTKFSMHSNCMICFYYIE